MCSSAKYEEIGMLELGHISNDEQSSIQSKKGSVESKPVDKKKVELGEVRCTRRRVSSMSEAMPFSPKTGKKQWKNSRQTSDNSEGPQDWQIREWNAELRENNICLNELNLKQKTEKLKKEFQLIEAERVIKEAAIQEKEKEVIVRKHYLERKEIEIEEKNHLLEIAIRVNKISLESRK